MHIDMERSREEYRSRYRDRHYQDKHRLVNDNQRRYSKPEPSNLNSSRYSPKYSTISSRHFHHSNNDDDYDYRQHSSSNFPISNRPISAKTNQINYYENYSPSSRHDRSLNYREVHSAYVNEQSIRSNNFFPPNSSHQRTSPITSSYNESERNQYISSSSYRRDSPPPPVSSHRNGRLIDHEIRNINNDFYIHPEYRSVTPPSLTSLSRPVEAYVDSYRSNDYASHSQRYDSPFNRTNPSSSSRSSSNNRNSKNISTSYESYPLERDYRPITHLRNDEIQSYDDRRHFKRPYSKYDNDRISSKRTSRR